MFSALRVKAQQNIVTTTRRQFGASSSSHSPNVSRMAFDEWKSLITKLHTTEASAADKQTIALRFKEAKLSANEVEQFQNRLKVQQMTDVEFEIARKDLFASPYAQSHPLTTAYNERVLLADRANQPRPDMFKVTIQQPKEYTKEELGNGTVAQKKMNEYIHKMQTDPELSYKRGAGFGLDRLDMAYIQKQSLLYFWTAIGFGFCGANLYRNMYMEKFSLIDMANWEARVITARALKERGW